MRKIIFGLLTAAATGCVDNVPVPVEEHPATTAGLSCQASVGAPVSILDTPCSFSHWNGNTLIGIEAKDLSAKWTAQPALLPAPFMAFSLAVVTPSWSCSNWTPESWMTVAYNELTQHTTFTAFAACADGDPTHVVAVAADISF